MSNPELAILVVDDDELGCELIRLYLERFGHQVDLALTGRSAVEQYAAQHYDLIFLDINLPDFDGYTVAKGMRRLESEAGETARRTIICALTSLSEEEAGGLALASGMNAFVHKPYTQAALQEMLNMAVQVAKAQEPFVDNEEPHA
jgi:CheY-like chemotaxis protein